MRLRIDVRGFDLKEIRLRQGVDYILTSPTGLVVSVSPDQDIYYSMCVGNGTQEVFISVQREMVKDEVFIREGGRVIPVRMGFYEDVLASHLDDVLPSFIEDEYPLFKKLMEYYFKYLGLEMKPSGFIHSMERYADVDETFDEFREVILREYVPYLTNTAADSKLLSKHILEFYTRRGTEDSIRFLLRVMFDKEVDIFRQRDRVLIASDVKQGLISEKSIVLADNYIYQLYAYTINISGVKFSEYRDPLYSMVNPTGYLPFGVTTLTESTMTVENGTYNIYAE